MEAITPSPQPPDPREAWNQAHDRLVHFLNTFALGDHSHVSRLALSLLDQAREQYRKDSTLDPTTLTMEHAQKVLADWLATNLGDEDRTPSHILADGYIALLLSRISLKAPSDFLTTTLAEDLRQVMRDTLVVTGPDLNISSMTPRHFDYGPMLHLARQTWHRWNGKAFVIAVLFWASVYTILYWAITEILL